MSRCVDSRTRGADHPQRQGVFQPTGSSRLNIRLYTTLGCHLCEEALRLVHHLQGQGMNIKVKEVEIADSDQLLGCYGIRVPVIAREDDEEIGWPFGLNELQQFLHP